MFDNSVAVLLFIMFVLTQIIVQVQKLHHYNGANLQLLITLSLKIQFILLNKWLALIGALTQFMVAQFQLNIISGLINNKE